MRTEAPGGGRAFADGGVRLKALIDHPLRRRLLLGGGRHDELHRLDLDAA
jgi:hypothetical protein